MKKTCTVIFLLLLSVLFVGSAALMISPVREIAVGYGGGIRGMLLTVRDTKTLENELNENVLAHNLWIQCYGGALRASGTDVVPEPDTDRTVYRMKNGALSFAVSPCEPFSEKEQNGILSLREAADRIGAQTWFVSVPQKNCSAGVPFAARGVPDHAEETDVYRSRFFADSGFSVLNLHEKMHEQDLVHEDMYFRTDHHWTAQAGLWAAGEIANALGLDTDSLQADRFTVEEHPDVFLGSEGKHTGTLYSGVDDINIPIPNFETNYLLDIPPENIQKIGNFKTALLFEEEMNGNYFDKFPYNTFLGGDVGLLKVQNTDMQDGKRVLLIKDSFTNCIAPYLACVCKEVALIDPRYFEDSITEYIAVNAPDAVCITISARQGNSTFTFS